MRPWPKAHKNLAVLVLLAVLAAGAVHFLLVRPKAQEVEGMEGRLAELKGALKDTGYMLNADTLETLLAENTKKLKGTKGERGDKGYAGLEERAGQILDLATRTFKQRIEGNYGDVKTFMDQAGWLDYQSDFTDLDTWLRGNGILISEKTFGISLDTANTETYQLLLHIWTVRELVQLAIDHELALAKDPSNAVPTPDGGTALPSKLTVLPMTAYALSTDDREPYLMEFPVRLTFRGSLKDFLAFVGSLQNESRFLALTRVELLTELPRLRGERPNEDGVLAVQNIEATVVCASFFRPGGKAPAVRLKQTDTAPRGA